LNNGWTVDSDSATATVDSASTTWRLDLLQDVSDTQSLHRRYLHQDSNQLAMAILSAMSALFALTTVVFMHALAPLSERLCGKRATRNLAQVRLREGDGVEMQAVQTGGEARLHQQVEQQKQDTERLQQQLKQQKQELQQQKQDMKALRTLVAQLQSSHASTGSPPTEDVMPPPSPPADEVLYIPGFCRSEFFLTL
jgi:uncharacterized coiled-coil protein SlyX